jgi:hypothetical protein
MPNDLQPASFSNHTENIRQLRLASPSTKAIRSAIVYPLPSFQSAACHIYDDYATKSFKVSRSPGCVSVAGLPPPAPLSANPRAEHHRARTQVGQAAIDRAARNPRRPRYRNYPAMSGRTRLTGHEQPPLSFLSVSRFFPSDSLVLAQALSSQRRSSTSSGPIQRQKLSQLTKAAGPRAPTTVSGSSNAARKDPIGVSR